MSETEVRDRKAADTTRGSTGDTATEKEAVLRRLGELHRLLKSRKGSVNATYKKNAKTNDKAYVINQKSLQALDAPVMEYVDFEVTMANVTHEQEADDTKDFPDCWAAQEATGVKLCNASKEVCNRRAAHEELCVDAWKALQRTRSKANGHGDARGRSDPQGVNQTYHE